MAIKAEIENLAEFIADTYCPDEMVDPEIIAIKNGITYSYGHYEDAFDGMLEFVSGDFHIYVNLDTLKKQDHPRARFTFSHELGHYYIDDHRNSSTLR